nr:YrrS family protein [Lysinibacillus timonensis]
MSRKDRDFLTRSELKRRETRTLKRRKLDRLLNVLIAIVAVLILINLYFVFSQNEETANEGNMIETSHQPNDVVVNNQENNSANSEASTEASISEDVKTEQIDEQEFNPNNNTTNEHSQNSTINENTNSELNEQQSSDPNNSSLVKQPSTDPLVEEVIVNPNWKVTPTNQTGQHVSTYEEGHIDYEEKKETIRNAVNLDKGNIIIWSVKNNGGSENAIAVISSKDQSEKYRVSIEWVFNEGWKPVKVEKLKQIDGAY